MLLEHVDRCNVDAHGKDLFGLATKGDEVEERPIGLEINEKVDVVRGDGAAGYRSEDTQIFDTVFLASIKQRGDG